MLTIEKLKTFGVDVETGLKRCVNNESLFLRLTSMVPNNDSFNKLYEAIKNNDLDNAFLAAHALKGIIANLSITPLIDVVNNITELLRNKTQMDYSPLVEEIEKKRKELELLCN